MCKVRLICRLRAIMGRSTDSRAPRGCVYSPWVCADSAVLTHLLLWRLTGKQMHKVYFGFRDSNSFKLLTSTFSGLFGITYVRCMEQNL